MRHEIAFGVFHYLAFKIHFFNLLSHFSDLTIDLLNSPIVALSLLSNRQYFGTAINAYPNRKHPTVCHPLQCETYYSYRKLVR